ncbi:MAG: substrate-binding domain-containing protein [Betaproteobacteria bacterium]|nr:substrate-binding domain-containing protein [Betaproteobacteria bacterium]
MNIRSLVTAANIGVVFLLGAGIAAHAAEISVLSSYGMRAVMFDVQPKFEQMTGHKVTFKFANSRGIEKRIQDRETADVVITGGVDFANGQVLPGSVTPVARTLIGMAVRKDAPTPDISSPDAVKRALLAAKSISHDDGPASIHFVKVLGRWGIADEMKRKTIMGGPPPRRVGDLVAAGEAEMGVHVLSLLVGIPGIEIVGPLPHEIQSGDVTLAAIVAGAKDVEAAKALIDFLRTPEAAAVIRAKGMVPAL